MSRPQRDQNACPRLTRGAVTAFLAQPGALKDDGRVDTVRLMNHLGWTDRTRGGISALKKRWVGLQVRVRTNGIDLPALDIVEPRSGEPSDAMHKALIEARTQLHDEAAEKQYTNKAYV